MTINMALSVRRVAIAIRSVGINTLADATGIDSIRTAARVIDSPVMARPKATRTMEPAPVKKEVPISIPVLLVGRKVDRSRNGVNDAIPTIIPSGKPLCEIINSDTDKHSKTEYP
ncbi:hypothetical protein QUA62_23415 [Microcoleus sp. MON1_C1]|jgi:hypothetical protein|uniref:hypothetical protein n=1 Tax=Microcoleus sp. MON1_C1 TaxID=2818827 RepID=UPI002FD62212